MLLPLRVRHRFQKALTRVLCRLIIRVRQFFPCQRRLPAAALAAPGDPKVMPKLRAAAEAAGAFRIVLRVVAAPAAEKAAPLR